MAVKLGSAGVNYLMTVVAAVAFGLSSAGQLAATVSWASLVASFTHLGHGAAATKIVAVSRDRPPDLRTYVAAARLETLGASMIVIAVGFIGLGGLLPNGPSRSTEALLVVAAILPMALHRLYEGVARGLGRVVVGFVPFSLGVPVLSVLVFVGLRTVGFTEPWIPAASYLLALFAMLLPAVIIAGDGRVASKDGGASLGSSAPLRRRSQRPTALRLMIFSSAGFTLRNADVAILGVMVDAETVGWYALLSRLAWLLSTVLFAINAALAPRVAKLYSDGDVAAVRRLFARSQVVSGASMLSLAIVLIVVIRPVTTFIGVELPRGALAVLAVLLLGQVASGAAGPVGALLSMAGAERKIAPVGVLVAVVCVVGVVVGVCVSGVAGAAMATALAIILNSAMLTVVRVRHFKETDVPGV